MFVRPAIKILKTVNSQTIPILCKCTQLQRNRYISAWSSKHFNKLPTQYEYDPQTDTFRPKTFDQSKSNTFYDRPKFNQSNSSHRSSYSSNDQSESKYGGFFKKFIRNLFLITGGVVWTGVIIITLFVDVNETEIEMRLNDMESQVRLLAFYDVIPNTEKGIWQILHDKDSPIPHIQPPEKKEKIFNDALHYVRQNREIMGYLGKPVQLGGFLAAKKVNALVEDYKNVAKYGYDYKFDDANSHENIDVENKAKQWRVECVLDAPKGMALLTMEFESNDDQEDWRLKRIHVQRLVNDNRDLFVEENETGIVLKST